MKATDARAVPARDDRAAVIPAVASVVDAAIAHGVHQIILQVTVDGTTAGGKT